MSHRLGSLLLPAPPAERATESAGDPGLDVLACALKEVLTAWLGDLWASVTPRVPVVRKVVTHDPQEMDFHQNDLPLLAVWREADTAPKRLADGYQETESLIRVAWTPPLTTQNKDARRHALFGAFDKAISLLVLHERDPAYMHPSDRTGPDAVAAAAYGSDILKHAGFDHWQLQRVERGSLDVPVGASVHRFPCYVASLLVREGSFTDPAVTGVPFKLRFHVTGPSGYPVLERADASKSEET